MTYRGEILKAIPFSFLDKVLSPELGTFNRIISFLTFRELVKLDTTFDINGLSCIAFIQEDFFNQWFYTHSSQLAWLIKRRARVTSLKTHKQMRRIYDDSERCKMQQNMREMFRSLPMLQSLEMGGYFGMEFSKREMTGC